MERWCGRVALVTGVGNGIGEAVARFLVPWGIKVAGLDIRQDKLTAVENNLRRHGEMKGILCDLTKEADIVCAFKWVRDNWGTTDIIINNAAVLSPTYPSCGNTQDWRRTFETNVLAMGICAREGIQSMKSCGVDDGHIININSVAGHKTIPGAGLSYYSASKNAVRVLTECLRIELAQNRSMIRVSSVSPGLVETDMATVWRGGLPCGSPYLLPDDVAEAVLYVLASPCHVNISELIVQPTGELI